MGLARTRERANGRAAAVPRCTLPFEQRTRREASVAPYGSIHRRSVDVTEARKGMSTPARLRLMLLDPARGLADKGSPRIKAPSKGK